MTYISISYYILVIASVALYYIFPQHLRYITLLITSGLFYYFAIGDKRQLVVFLCTILVSYFAGILLKEKKNRLLLVISIIVSALPLLISRILDLLVGKIGNGIAQRLIIPLGLSFYTMSIIAYLVDIYREKIEPEKNPLKFALFISFFPIIIQGPILRFDNVKDALFKGNKLNEKNIIEGFQLLLYGFFLKYMIADKASIFANAIFAEPESYEGFFILIGGILYTLQLYADFYSCVTMSQGVAKLYGIELPDNFCRPFFSRSIKELWRRWHLSLSSWLKDYVYIPLGGSRKGKLSKYLNLTITFLVSGLWHGGTVKYLVWGAMQAFYQIMGELLKKPREALFKVLKLDCEMRLRRIIESVFTAFLFMVSLVIFRADTLKTGIKMLISMVRRFNAWVLFDGSLFELGLSAKQFNVLILSTIVLFFISYAQERGVKVRDWVNEQHIVIRWILTFGMIFTIWIFGTYGFGYNAADFIYGGF